MSKKRRKAREKSVNLLLVYCSGHLLFFAQDGDQKGGVVEPEVVQKRQFIATTNATISR